MEVRPWPSRAASQDLSKALPFTLGPLSVDPPTRRVSAIEQDAVLEPRVMRVLVALASAGGRVLSRDDLIALCWDGQIVGDNAINRVISRLRHVLAELAGERVKLETITKVGFRLVSDGNAPANGSVEPPVSPSLQPPPADERRALAVDRRWLIGAGTAAALTLAAGVGWRSITAHRPNPEAVRLVERGNVVMKSARLGTTPEAIKLYRKAVKIDPDYADGWGALASSYRHALGGYGREERSSYPQMIRSAVDRALALDPAQPDALLAKATILPEYGNWLVQEKDLRALVQRFPNHWYVNARLGILLREVGRFDDAMAFADKVPKIDVQLAPAWAGLIHTLTLSGRFHEADAAFDDALSNIAPHPSIWFARYSTLLESRRYTEAAAFAIDSRTMPEEFPSRIGQTYTELATSLANKDKVGISKALDYVKSNLSDAEYVPRAAPMLVMLGEPETAFAAYWAYLLGGRILGHEYPAPGPLDPRETATLFGRSLIPLRQNSRFPDLLKRTGLEDYWRRSGSQPDFRRN